MHGEERIVINDAAVLFKPCVQVVVYVPFADTFNGVGLIENSGKFLAL